MNNLVTEATQFGNPSTGQSIDRQLLNKVPEITIFFWIIKVLCTTVGETVADFLNMNLGFGLTGTSIVTGILLAVALFFQFKSKKYIPSIYWLAVVLISVFGTLVTDNLTDSMGVPLETSTIFFSVALALTFAFWYAKEKTLSIHSIFTARREVFYWLAILFTFALGTAAGDLMAEGLGLGYLLTGIIVAGVIAVIGGAWRFGLNPVLSFWLIYIMTRPLGASLGDFLSQTPKHDGLGLGATITSVIFLGAILGVVTYLTVTKRDVIRKVVAEENVSSPKNAFLQTALAIGVLILVAGTGYHYRQASLQGEISNVDSQEMEQATSPETISVVSKPSEVTDTPVQKSDTGDIDPKIVDSNNTAVATTPITKPAEVPKLVVTTSPFGNLSAFKTITQDTLNLVMAGKPADAEERIGDLEYEWDNAEAKLKRMDGAEWTKVDDAIDAVLRQVRAVKPDQAKCESLLKALLGVLG